MIWLCALMQVPVAFSPAKHRSTQIDTEKVLQGTSDTHQALAQHTAACRRASAGRSKSQAGHLNSLHARRAASASPAGSKARHASKPTSTAAAAAALDTPQITLYQSDYALTAAAGLGGSDAGLLQHSPATLAAARRTLEASSEWAALNQLEQARVAQEVSRLCVAALATRVVWQLHAVVGFVGKACAAQRQTQATMHCTHPSGQHSVCTGIAGPDGRMKGSSSQRQG